MPCFCGNNQEFEVCCQPIILGKKVAPTPETLMRSRFSAYATGHVSYLVASTYPSYRHYFPKSEIQKWSSENQWIRLEIIIAHGNEVEFKAYYLDRKNRLQVHHEKSTFISENGIWYFLDGQEG